MNSYKLLQLTINNNVKRTTKKNINGKRCSCSGWKNTMHCRQVEITTSFTSYKNKKTLKIFQILTCDRNFFVYLTKCVSCKLQPSKSETSFNLRLNNHRSVAFHRNAIRACRYFLQDKRRFNKYA